MLSSKNVTEGSSLAHYLCFSDTEISLSMIRNNRQTSMLARARIRFAAFANRSWLAWTGRNFCFHLVAVNPTCVCTSLCLCVSARVCTWVKDCACAYMYVCARERVWSHFLTVRENTKFFSFVAVAILIQGTSVEELPSLERVASKSLKLFNSSSCTPLM